MILSTTLESGRFVVCGEVRPPQSCNADVVREQLRYFKGYVDAVNATDNQTATVRMSSIATAKIVLDEGVEPIMQVTCRDRNRLAIQSDLLGAAALGIRNVLCLTGDHQSVGDQPEARGVFDLDSIQLIDAVATMNRGLLLSGREMKTAPDFLIGAAANPFAEPFEMRLIRLQKKIDAGARFIQTQPVFSLEVFTRWMGRVVEMGLDKKAAILAGVMPVRSAKTLQWMKARVPGTKIENEYVDRLSHAHDPEQEGVLMAVELIQALKNLRGVRGIHIMPVMWESVTPTIIKEAGLAVSQ